jgi:thioredoxin reductase/Pyruvate/2-oxoacid:ferredoxin oxidoreductase delta subunit
MQTLIAFLVAVVITSFFVRGYLKSLKKRDERAREAAEKGKLFSEGPKSQHPHIDVNYCIGCQTCTTVCPEGDVLAMLGGKAVIVNGYKCIGHSLCAEACPVGAITMVMASPSMSADMPYLTPEHETTIPNLFIVGELGGLALIKNAVNQGRECIDLVAERIAEGEIPRGPGFRAPAGGQKPAHTEHGEIHDVLIVGAGPGGISASLRAIERKLSYITLERDEVGGTVAKYPRQKLVMTSPVEFPMYGKFKKTELSKEHLLAFWDMILNRADFNVRTGEKVEGISKDENGIFTVSSATNQYRTRAVVLALGRAGEPRKLGVKGEELPKVMYRLIEADHYVNKRILVVGGGDSAVEAAMGLASQVGNQVTLSYRQERFGRIKERNAKRIEDFMRTGKLKVLFNSNPIEFKPESVILEVKGEVQEISNDFVWIFAGGTPPNDFLEKIGVGFGNRDLTLEASTEAKQAVLAKQQFVQANAAGVK